MAVQSETGVPYPGDELAFRVSGQTDPYVFAETGRMSREAFERALASVGRGFSDFERLLDFGCGCGRVAAWLEDVARDVDIHGVDIDDRAISWASKHIPWAQFSTNGTLPPLDAADGEFDLVINHSVFSHLDADYQDRWLEELRRVTRPGATLVLSVDGEFGFQQFEQAIRDQGADPSAHRERFAREGILFVEDDDWFGTAMPDCYHSTFHAPWYVLEHWSQWFEVKAYLPRNALGRQDHVVLEHPEEGRTPVRYSSRAWRPTAAANGRADAGAPRALAARLATRLRRRLDVARALRHQVHAAEVARRGLVQQSQRLDRLEKEVLERLEALEDRGKPGP